MPAKVSPPRALGLAPRPRLFERLDELGSDGIVWVAAPAGSGKSSLVASYLRARRLVAFWYNVDARDEDAAVSFAALRDALATAAPRRAHSLPVVGPEGLIALPAFARNFFERLHRALPARAVIVLDDYHEISDVSAFHELVRVAFATLPPGRRAIVMSRAGPPATLARDVVHGRLRSLEPSELLLTLDEARDVGSVRAGRALAPGAIAAALARAEGWLAGFLLLLGGSGRAAAPGENSSALFEYFASEILGAMPVETQRALAAAALLPRFDEALVAELTGAAPDAVDVRRLARSGLFLAALGDSARPSFRYHALFRAFLLDRLPRSWQPAELRALELRAAALCERSDAIDEAVTLYARAGELTELARVIVTRAPELFARGQCRTLSRWLALLPDNTIASNGWLLYWRATAGLFQGAAPSAIQAQYAAAQRAFDARSDRVGGALATSGYIQAIVYEGNDFRRLDEPAQRLAAAALEDLALPPEIELQVASAVVMALSFREGELAGVDAEGWLERASRLVSTAVSTSQRLMVLGQLLFYRALRGEMAEATLLSARIERASSDSETDPLAAAHAFVARALTAWLAADEDGCIAAVEAGLGLTERTGFTMLRDVLFVYGTFGALGKEDAPRVARYLDELGHLADSGRALDTGNYYSLVAWDSLERRDFATARRALERSRESALALGGTFALALNALLQALFEFETGDEAASRASLTRAAELERRLGNRGLYYWRKLVEAHLAVRNERLDEARARLADAFARGRELGVYNALWPTRRELAELCVMAIEAGIEPDYVQSLVRRKKLVAARPPESAEAWPFRLQIRLFGPLSIDVDGAAVPFGAKAPKVPLSLLAALVLFGHDGRDVAAEKLMDELWPDSDGDASLHAFEVALYRLRKLLGDESLVRLQAGRLRLDPASTWSDYGACLAALARVERGRSEHGADGARDRDVERLRALRDRDLLVGWSQPWVVAARQAIRRRIERALGELDDSWSFAAPAT